MNPMPGALFNQIEAPLENNGYSSEKSPPDPENELIRLSDMTSGVRPFFLDYSFFTTSFDLIFEILGKTSPGPSSQMDLYQLYCLHVQGDAHIFRLVKSICETSRRHTEITRELNLAKEKSPEYGQKKKKKLREFYSSRSLIQSLHSPFIIPEFSFRSNLQNIWRRDMKFGSITKNQKCKIYQQYCLHMLEHSRFFDLLFSLTMVIPNGPYQVSQLEQSLIMFKAVPDVGNFPGPDATTLAFYIKQEFGVEHEFFGNLPPVLRSIVSNERVKLVLRKAFSISRANKTSHEWLQLCSTSPSSAGVGDRVQMQFPSELLNPNYADVFSWIFLATEDPAVFLIRNEQWNDFLTVDKNLVKGCYSLTTTLNQKDTRARFTISLEGEAVKIVSVVTATPLIVDETSLCVVVPESSDRSCSLVDASMFLLKNAS